MGKVLETFLMIEDLKFCGINLVMYKNLKRKIPEWLIDIAKNNKLQEKYALIIDGYRILRFLINFCAQKETRFFKADCVNYLNHNCFNRKNYLLVKGEKILKSINYILIWRLNNDTLNNNFFT